MNTPSFRSVVGWLAAVLCVVAGCRKSERLPVDAAAIAKAASDPEVVTKLSAADAVDGVVDGVVARCAGCGLGMEGSDQHTLIIGAYKMYFCSERCRAAVAGDVTQRILALSIPDGD